MEKVGQLLERKGAGLALRVSVQPSGCSGMGYLLFFTVQYAKALAKDLAERADEEFPEADDEEAAQRVEIVSAKESVVRFDQFAVVLDTLSGPYLDGVVIDYCDTLQKQGFTLDNLDLGPEADTYHLLSKRYGLFVGETTTPDGQRLPMLRLYPETEGAGIEDLGRRTDWQPWDLRRLSEMDFRWHLRVSVATLFLEGTATGGLPEGYQRMGVHR
ncbi:HesB/IscA family protein [Streptomyces sp. NPDC002403]